MKSIYKKRTNSFILVDYETQFDYLYSFKEPANNFERSLFQYKCQMKDIPFSLRLLQNILAIFLFPYYFIKLSYTTKGGIEKNYDALFLCEGVSQQIIPDNLKLVYSKIKEVSFNEKMTLDSFDRKFISKMILKYWYLPFFCIKNVLKIALFSNAIYRYNPKIIIVHNEYSFTSSILTEYCNSKGIEQVNVMHGEKLFNIRDAFVNYNKFYVWDMFYISLFKKLRAQERQFVIGIPEALDMHMPNLTNIKFEYTYYLGNENEDVLKRIRDNLDKLNVSNEKICIRYHPRYSDIELIQEIFTQFWVENPLEVSIVESISHTKNVISLYSTVLYQAHHNKKNVIIDNLSDSIKFKMLKNLNYIMLSKNLVYLSKVLEEENKSQF